MNGVSSSLSQRFGAFKLNVSIFLFILVMAGTLSIYRWPMRPIKVKHNDARPSGCHTHLTLWHLHHKLHALVVTTSKDFRNTKVQGPRLRQQDQLQLEHWVEDTASGTPEQSERNVLQCHFIQRESHTVSVLQAEACNKDTTPTQPHRNSNTQRTKNNTTNVVIQQNSRKLLMMDIYKCPKHVEHIRSEIKYQVTSSWSFILQLKLYALLQHTHWF